MVSLAATLGEGKFPKTGGWDDFPSRFRAAISVSGAYDLVKLDWGAGWSPIGETFPAARDYASPIRHVNRRSGPILILHSDDDPSVPIDQAERMVAALRAARAPYRFVRFRDKGHMFMPPECITVAREFIDANAK